MVRVPCGQPMSGISRRTHVEEVFNPDVVAAALILSTEMFCDVTYLVIPDVREHQKWSYDPCDAGYRSNFPLFPAAHILRDVRQSGLGKPVLPLNPFASTRILAVPKQFLFSYRSHYQLCFKNSGSPSSISETKHGSGDLWKQFASEG